MRRKAGSALVYALMLLALVTLISTNRLRHFAQWRDTYVREAQVQEAVLKSRYQRWLDEQE